MSNTLTIIKKKGTQRLVCECGGELYAAVNYHYSGIPVYMGNEMNGSPYGITVNDDDELTLELDSFSSSYQDSEIAALYCHDCKTTVNFDEDLDDKVILRKEE